jgi:hypothetical protein
MIINVLICVALVSVLVTVVRGEQELLIDRPPPMMEMTVEVRPNTALLGDTVSIVISATNREKETIRLPFRAIGCAFSFRITGPNGGAVKVRPGCPREAESLTLVPGETVRDSYVLVSWNFKHIVNLQRIHGYNSVTLRQGYPMIEIRTPREVLSND